MKSQDIIIALAIRLLPHETWTYPILSATTGIAISQAHSACLRLKAVRLLRQDPGERWQISGRNLKEFLVHGVQYAFYAKIGSVTRGVPTALAAPFAAEALGKPSQMLVWPDMHGTARGLRLDPLHRSQHTVIAQAGGDAVYRALACVDILRTSSDIRERSWAVDHLTKTLAQNTQ